MASSTEQDIEQVVENVELIPVANNDPATDGEVKETFDDDENKPEAEFSVKAAGGGAGPARDILKLIKSILSQIEKDNKVCFEGLAALFIV